MHVNRAKRSTTLGVRKIRSPTALVSLLTIWPAGF